MTLPGSHAHQMPRGRIDDIAREFRDVWTAMRERTAAGPVVAAASRVAYVEDYGPIGEGDDSAAFVAALAVNRRVFLREKTYYINARVTVQAGNSLVGCGGSMTGVSAPATRILCGSSGSIWMRGAGCTLQGLAIDGAGVGANLLIVGGTAAGDAGTSPMLFDVTVMQAAAGGIAWQLAASQNGTVLGVNLLNNAGEGLVVSDHAGGWLFDRMGITGSGTRNLRINNAGNLLFQKCLIERALDVALSPVLIEGLVWFPTIKFAHTTFASGGVYATSGVNRALVEHAATGTVEFDSCPFAGITDEVAIRAGGGGTAPIVHITGSTYFTGAGLFAFLDYDSTSIVDLEGEVRGQVAGLGVGTVPLRTATSPVGNIGRFRQSSNVVYRTATTQTAFASLVNGDTVARFEQLIDGTQKWGTGSATADLSQARSAAGVLSLAGRHHAKSHSSPQTNASVASGTATCDASVSDNYLCVYNGAVTGLTVTNMSNDQQLRVTFIQQSGGSLDLSGVTGIKWADAVAPSSPGNGNSVSCTFVQSGGVLYEVARSRTAPAPETAWTTATITGTNVSSYTTGGYPAVSYRKIMLAGTEFVMVRGLIQASGGNIAASTTMFTLPAGYRPTHPRTFANYNGGVTLTTAGAVINVAQVLSGGFLGVDNLVFTTT